MKKLALYIILSILNITCYAQDYQKNGYPCVNELCVGDGLSELSKVN